MQKTSQITVVSILCLIVIYISLLGFGILPEAFTSKAEHAPLHAIESITYTPPLWAISPFILLLLSIAILPLLSSTQIWWHNNKNRFLVVMVLSGITLLYYGFFHPGGLENHFTHELSSTHGLKTLWTAFSNAIFSEFIPFIVLLFSLYVISGGPTSPPRYQYRIYCYWSTFSQLYWNHGCSNALNSPSYSDQYRTPV